MKTRLKILLGAHFCSPDHGGEWGLGWQVATRLAKNHDVTVICGDLKSSKPTHFELEAYHKKHGAIPGLTIHHLTGTMPARILHTLHWKIPVIGKIFYYQAYRIWQKQAMELARKLHAKEPFDLAHQVTNTGFREPGYLWQLGIPFFWGPVNGANYIPQSFSKQFGIKGWIEHTLRNWANQWQQKTCDLGKHAAAAAHKIWVVSEGETEMVKKWGYQSTTIPDGACTPIGYSPKDFDGPLRLSWCGLFTHRKALPLLLHAMARKPEIQISLDIIGDGPQEKAWKALALALQIDHKITWHGRVSHQQSKEIVSNTHALIHTSLKEGTCHTIMEALSNNVPSVCHDACGMKYTINESCGIKIPLVDPETSIKGFAAAIVQLQAPKLREKLAQGAHNRAYQFTWDQLIQEIQTSYEQHAFLPPKKQG